MRREGRRKKEESDDLIGVNLRYLESFRSFDAISDFIGAAVFEIVVSKVECFKSDVLR